MFNSAERLISFRNLRPKKKEGFLKIISIFSFLGISIGVAILIIVMSVMNGFRAELTNKILGLNPHVTIDPNSNNITDEFKKKLLKEINNFDSFNSYQGEGIILSSNNAKGIVVKGVEKSNLSKIFDPTKIVEGNYENFERGSIFIGGELAFNLQLNVGDNINIVSSSLLDTPLGGFPKQETFKVSGIFNSGFYEFDQNLVYVNLNDALSLFDKLDKDINLEIYLSNPMEANSVKNKIQKIEQNYFIYSWSDVNKSFFSALKIERNVMFIILTLIIIVAAFNIISGLTILIKNKTKEIAILKTLGLSNNSIKKSFFLTGFTIGLTATIFGTSLGILFSLYVEKIRQFLSSFLKLNIFPSDIYFLDKMPSEIDFNSIAIIFICSLLITSVASYFPARSISRMETTRALKYD